jgi:ABC-type multidrug transport system ATPase subunit
MQRQRRAERAKRGSGEGESALLVYGEDNGPSPDATQLQFEGLTASVLAPRSEVARSVILPGIQGSLSLTPGSVTAILGYSGSGKTTFLNAVAGRRANTGVGVSGQVRVTKGGVVVGAMADIQTSFVTQQPILLPSLTCRETFEFALAMRKPQLSERERAEFCSQLLEDLGLTSCADTRVGDALARGISGGQKKRVSIGAQLVTNPSALFLDEPSSGLDSHVALQLIKLLKRVAKQKKFAVICTIHQPSYTMYELVTHIAIFVRSGNVVFSGKRSEMTRYFNLNLKPVLPKINFRQTNPADHALEVLANLSAEQQHGVLEAYTTSLSQQREAEAKHAGRPSAPALDELQRGHDPEQQQQQQQQQRPSFGAQVKLLARRSWLIFVRLPWMLIAKLIHFLAIGLFVGSAFWQLDHTQASIQNRLGALYFTAIVQVFGGALSVVLTFAGERDVFLLEQETQMYSVAAYFTGKMLVDLPIFAAGTAVSSILVYLMTGLALSWVQFVNFQLIVLLVAFSGQAIGLIVAAAASTIENATLFTPLIISPSILITSYAFPLGEVPIYFEWLKFLSPFYFSFDGECSVYACV